MEKETLQPHEVRPKSSAWSLRLLNMARDSFTRHNDQRYFVTGEEKHQALIDKAAGIILQNPRLEDLKRVR